jgi:hypothetical protein
MILIVKAQIGDTGPVVTVRGRDAWALLKLKAANDKDCTPLMTIAGSEIVADEASAPSALDACSNLRTTTNGFPGGEARHGQMPFGRYRLEGPVTVAEGGAS